MSFAWAMGFLLLLVRILLFLNKLCLFVLLDSLLWTSLYWLCHCISYVNWYIGLDCRFNNIMIRTGLLNATIVWPWYQVVAAIIFLCVWLGCVPQHIYYYEMLVLLRNSLLCGLWLCWLWILILPIDLIYRKGFWLYDLRNVFITSAIGFF